MKPSTTTARPAGVVDVDVVDRDGHGEQRAHPRDLRAELRDTAAVGPDQRPQPIRALAGLRIGAVRDHEHRRGQRCGKSRRKIARHDQNDRRRAALHGIARVGLRPGGERGAARLASRGNAPGSGACSAPETVTCSGSSDSSTLWLSILDTMAPNRIGPNKGPNSSAENSVRRSRRFSRNSLNREHACMLKRAHRLSALGLVSAAEHLEERLLERGRAETRAHATRACPPQAPVPARG